MDTTIRSTTAGLNHVDLGSTHLEAMAGRGLLLVLVVAVLAFVMPALMGIDLSSLATVALLAYGGMAYLIRFIEIVVRTTWSSEVADPWQWTLGERVWQILAAPSTILLMVTFMAAIGRTSGLLDVLGVLALCLLKDVCVAIVPTLGE